MDARDARGVQAGNGDTVTHAFLGGLSLVKAAKRLATDVEPWATVIRCSVDDFVASGVGGNELRIPIRKPPTMPTSEDADWVHIVRVVPDRNIPAGVLGVLVT